MEHEAQVLVIGGGPAGSATALHLARAGVSVLLIERDTFPKQKCCGEGIMPHGVKQIEELGLLDAVREAQAMPFDGITYRHGKHEASGCFPGGEEGIGIRRLRLDALFHQAILEQAGVRVVPAEMNHIEVDNRCAVVTCGDQVFRGQVVVGADGLNSQVRKQRGLEARRAGRNRYGGNFHLELPESRPQYDKVEVHFSKGYEIYLTPVAPREVCVAILCEKAQAKSLAGDRLGGLRRLAEACPSFPRDLVDARTISEGFFCGPLRQTVPKVVADRTALVGDAAGFLDPITGEGLSVALVSAKLLAGVISSGLESGDLSAAGLLPYGEAREAGIRDALILTEVILWWIRTPLLPAHVVRNLGKRPEVFEKMLGVAAGSAGLGSLGLSEIRGLALP